MTFRQQFKCSQLL